MATIGANIHVKNLALIHQVMPHLVSSTCDESKGAVILLLGVALGDSEGSFMPSSELDLVRSWGACCESEASGFLGISSDRDMRVRYPGGYECLIVEHRARN